MFHAKELQSRHIDTAWLIYCTGTKHLKDKQTENTLALVAPIWGSYFISLDPPPLLKTTLMIS